MCLLWGTNWVFISQKTTFLIATAVKTSDLHVACGVCVATSTKNDLGKSRTLLEQQNGPNANCRDKRWLVPPIMEDKGEGVGKREVSENTQAYNGKGLLVLYRNTRTLLGGRALTQGWAGKRPTHVRLQWQVQPQWIRESQCPCSTSNRKRWEL
jgi:hypothetical protein